MWIIDLQPLLVRQYPIVSPLYSRTCSEQYFHSIENNRTYCFPSIQPLILSYTFIPCTFLRIRTEYTTLQRRWTWKIVQDIQSHMFSKSLWKWEKQRFFGRNGRPTVCVMIKATPFSCCKDRIKMARKNLDHQSKQIIAFKLYIVNCLDA